ncbi:Regulator of chromosome condensation (RCC1) family protein [Striga hermonthica]|uniref:Regulator of chromosome condensation (RCC1) family protein n=1 Tax=Striga hermonthica TaxID=68872 RepID=A0A9N7MK50_STRHE|nr:Regulator of chromosome condensation (RCC1) family protein [Striga hermonthica]
MLRSLNARNGSQSGRLIGLGRRLMSTTVMSFGDGSHGALGLSSSPMGLGFDAYEPTPITTLPPDVCGVTAGHYHSLAVTSQGQVWAWGRNSELQLGRGPLSPREQWNEPQKVEGLDQVKVADTFASGVVSAATGYDGTLWVWGKSKRGQLGLGKDITEAVSPSRVEALLGHEIVKVVSLGWGHALALTEDGKLFGWGYYSDGRLGKIGKPFEASPLDSIAGKVKSSSCENSNVMIEAAEQLVLEAVEKEKDMPIIWEPTQIEELHDVDVMDVACGLDHSLVLCSDGTLLSSGSNVYGQLGRAKNDLGFHAVDMKFSDLRPIRIASGLGHSLAICTNMLSEDGTNNVVTWGWNQNCQLGREGSENVPLVVAGFDGVGLTSVSGGRVHSLAVTNKCEVWSWGCGRNGRLGLGSSTDEPEPMLIEHLEGRQVFQAVAGFDHNLVLVNDAS